ncbi:MAG: N-acetylmuramoyl-L-alanine amidase [Microcystaceae cyanobacterium]
MTNKFLFLLPLGVIYLGINVGIAVAQSQPERSLFISYPPDNHQTTARQIFIIGSAPPGSPVVINNQTIDRSSAGYFAAVFPLQMGENQFNLRYGNQTLERTIIRGSNVPVLPNTFGFAVDSLYPNRNISRLPQEPICFKAIAPGSSIVNVQIANQTIPLTPQDKTVQLPENNAVLNNANQPIIAPVTQYEGCARFTTLGNLGSPIFELQGNGQRVEETAKGSVTILDPNQVQVVAITAKPGVARTGPTTDHSRLTPLPAGTQASVTGTEGDWLRLDYGAWINSKETQTLTSKTPPRSLIRSINYRALKDATEIVFPLQVPVPISVKQEAGKFSLTLHNVTAQTDTIRLDNDPIIERMDWQPLPSNQIKYNFYFKSKQQWGYDLRYEDTSLVLSLRHPPQLTGGRNSLKGANILLDAGHGGKEPGAIGPNGYPEKAINLLITQKLAALLRERGATVYLTRDTDKDVSLQERVDQINAIKPAIALSISIHYNSLPDGGDPIKTKGLSAFWFQPQSQQLATFLQTYLVKKLDRSSYGVYWDNLALARPHTAPAVLLELGFMINPQEFEWITNPQEQDKLANALAAGITEWFHAQ